MIRINLLAVSKAKNKRAAIAVSIPGEGMNVTVKILVVVLVTASLNMGYWYQLTREKARIADQMTQADRKNRELAAVKSRYLEREKQMQAYKRRVDVIDQLRSAQFGPVNLMASMGDTVNRTEAVWLSTMRDNGTNIDIEGMALSQDAVANLISNLQRSGFFKSVEIKESYQDDHAKELQSFFFTLVCEKKS